MANPIHKVFGHSWYCLDCEDTRCTKFLLKDEVWRQACLVRNNNTGITLCFQCTQKRLNRAITFSDISLEKDNDGKYNLELRRMILAIAVMTQSTVEEMLQFQKLSDSEIFDG